MDELEKMKALWSELNDKVAALENENRVLARKITNEKYISAKDRLVRKYSFFIVLEVWMILFTFAFVLWNPLIVERYRIATFIYLTFFFLAEGILDFYLRQRILKIDIYHSTVKEISNQAAYNWKLHKLAIIAGVPIAIGAIILLALALNANESTFYGMIVGGIVGACIGLFQLKRFYQNYKLLQTSEE